MNTNAIPSLRPEQIKLRPTERFWRNRLFARFRHYSGAWTRRPTSWLTRAHAAAIRLSGGRIRRSFFFTGGMPILVLTTVGRKSGRVRSAPLGYTKHGDAFVVIAGNAGSDHVPAWWLNLQAEPSAKILADRTTYSVIARRAAADEDKALWEVFARLNPGFDEYRKLTTRNLPVIILDPAPATGE